MSEIPAQHTPRADNLYGAPDGGLLSGGPGNDTLTGLSGNGTIDGGPGNDSILGGAGDNVLRGGPGNDTILGGPGTDAITGGPGADLISGGLGADTIDGGPGNDLYLDWSDANALGDHFRFVRPSAVGSVTGQGGSRQDGSAGADGTVSIDVDAAGISSDVTGLTNGAAGRGGPGGTTHVGAVVSGDVIGNNDLSVHAGDDGGKATGGDANAAGGGFGRDTILGFDQGLDRIEFIGYRPQDLVGIDAHAAQSSQNPLVLVPVWHFAFVDGSDLTVEFAFVPTPSGLLPGIDYIFMP